MTDRSNSLVTRVGRELKAFREEQRLTQAEIAARLSLQGDEVSPKTISSWELGRTPLPLPMIERLAQVFRVDTGYLGRRLGFCGTPAPRDIVIAEGADALNQLADEPPEVAETILRWLRESIEIARSGRLARTI